MIAESVRVMGGDGSVVEESSFVIVISDERGSPHGERVTRRDSDDVM